VLGLCDVSRASILVSHDCVFVAVDILSTAYAYTRFHLLHVMGTFIQAISKTILVHVSIWHAASTNAGVNLFHVSFCKDCFGGLLELLLYPFGHVATATLVSFLVDCYCSFHGSVKVQHPLFLFVAYCICSNVCFCDLMQLRHYLFMSLANANTRSFHANWNCNLSLLCPIAIVTQLLLAMHSDKNFLKCIACKIFTIFYIVMAVEISTFFCKVIRIHQRINDISFVRDGCLYWGAQCPFFFLTNSYIELQLQWRRH